LQKPRLVFALAAVLVGAGLAGITAATERGYYKWMDERGNPQHSDRPPPAGVKYEFIATESGLSRRVDLDPPDNANETSPGNPAARGQPASAGIDKIEIEKNPALCDQAKANLDTLNSKAKVRIRDDEGIRYLSEEEKEVQRKKARDLVAVHCN